MRHQMQLQEQEEGSIVDEAAGDKAINLLRVMMKILYGTKM